MSVWRTTMYWPSGVHTGSIARMLMFVNTARGSVPSAFMIQRLFWPSRSEMNAISEPSGEKTGWMLSASPEFCVMLAASPPPAGIR